MRKKLNTYVRKVGHKIAAGVVVKENHNDPQLEAFRKSKCDGCAHNDGHEEYPTCKLCDCFLDIKQKALTNYNKYGRLEITHCPAGKWEDADIAETNGDIAEFFKPQ